MVKKIIVVNPDGTAVNPEDDHLVPEKVRQEIRSNHQQAATPRKSLAELLGPTPEQIAAREAKFREFLARKAETSGEAEVPT